MVGREAKSCAAWVARERPCCPLVIHGVDRSLENLRQRSLPRSLIRPTHERFVKKQRPQVGVPGLLVPVTLGAWRVWRYLFTEHLRSVRTFTPARLHHRDNRLGVRRSCW